MASGGIEVCDLNLAIDNESILSGLDFHLPEMQTSAFLGPGGSGKSTLLGVLAGRHDHLAVSGSIRRPPLAPCTLPQAGSSNGSHLQILTDNCCPKCNCPSVEHCIPAALARDGIHGLERVRRTIQAVWEPHSQEASQTLSAAAPHIDGDLPKDLHRLLMLTAVVATGSRLLLLDEPDSGINPHQVDWVINLLKALKGTRTIVLVTRSIRVAREVADQCLLFADHSLLEIAPVNRFFDAPEHPRTQHFVRMGC